MGHVDRSGDCWLWQGGIHQKTGYGQAWYQNTNRLAHRAFYELLVGPIPAGLQLDHLCRVRHCVNPEHLEPVTARVNTLRGDTLPARNAAKTECDHGHEFTPENTYFHAKKGARCCRACKNARQRTPEARAKVREWWARRTEATA
jgi:hypothetical protein